MSKFSILGKTKKQKFWNIIGLIVLGLFLLSKTDLSSFKLEHEIVHKELVSLQSVNIKSLNELQKVMQKYQINMVGVEKEAESIGVSLTEFKNTVKMVIATPTDILKTKEFTLEFVSNKEHSVYKPIYRYIANDIKQFIIKQK